MALVIVLSLSGIPGLGYCTVIEWCTWPLLIILSLSGVPGFWLIKGVEILTQGRYNTLVLVWVLPEDILRGRHKSVHSIIAIILLTNFPILKI